MLDNFEKFDFLGEHNKEGFELLIDLVSAGADISIEQFKKLFLPRDQEYVEKLEQASPTGEITENTMRVVKNFFNHSIKMETIIQQYLSNHSPLVKSMVEHLEKDSCEEAIKKLLFENNFLVTSKEMHFLWKSLGLPSEFKPKESTYEEMAEILFGRYYSEEQN